MTNTGLPEKLIHSKRDAGGTIAKNRLTFQVSYGMQLIMEFFSTDSVVVMDYFEDIAILNNPNNPDTIKLYQIKTKNTPYPLSLTAVISQEWLQKLYRNARQFGEYFEEGHLVYNDDIIHEETKAFVNLKNCLKDPKNTENCRKIKSAIANDLNIPEDEVDLTKFFVIRTYLSTMDHKANIEHEFETFLQKEHEDIQVSMARTIFRNIYDMLDGKHNREYCTKATDLTEIIENKGVKISDANAIVKTGIRKQVPQKEKIFSDFSITTLKTRQKFGTAYARVKVDMHKSEDDTFSELENIINDCIEKNNEATKEEIVERVYSEVSTANNIPLPYKEESYLRLLIMILVIQYEECE